MNPITKNPKFNNLINEFKPYTIQKRKRKRKRKRNESKRSDQYKRAYEFDEGLVAISADVALGVDDLAEGFTELDELLLSALPGEIAEMEDL